MKITQFLNKHKGFKQFLVKTGVLIIFLVVLQFLSNPLVSKIKIPSNFNTIEYTLLGGVLIFSFILFMLLIKDKLKQFKIFKSNLRDFILFGIAGSISYFLFFYSKYLISINLEFANSNFLLFFIGRHLILFMTLFLFALAIFSKKFVVYLLNNFKREIGLSALSTFLFVFFALVMQNTWQFLSGSITKLVYWLLIITFNEVSMPTASSLVVGDFTVNIGKVCSGIESILLFTILYVFILFLDWKKLDKKKMFLLFIPGILGTILANVLRIYLIMLIGILGYPQLSVGIFHTNAGWIFFIAYFFIFWKIFYRI